MPTQIIIIAVLFIGIGFDSLTEMIESWVGGRMSIDFAFIMLPVGIDLLRGNARSLMWAKALAIILYFITITGIIILVGFDDISRSIVYLGIKGPPALILGICGAGLLGLYTHLACNKENVKRYFAENQIEES